MAAASTDLVLYGATGFTGRLIAWELTRRGVGFTVAGRDAVRLRVLAEDLPWKPEARVATIDDPVGLRAAFADARVVLSAAGPYVTAGPPVLAAALDSGAHFLDVTGEQTFLRHAWEQHERVEEAGLTVVNGMGFDVVPSDVAAHVSCTAMDRVERVDLCIETDARLSGGTRRSMALAGGQGWWYDAGRFRPGPPGRFRRTFRFPADLPRFYSGHERDPTADPLVRHGLFVPWGDCITAPRTTGARQVRTFFATTPDNAQRFGRLWPVVGAVAAVPPLRRLVARRMGSRAKPSGHGPNEAQREAARFAVLAEATGHDGTVQRGLVTGRDPYGLTAASAAEAARILLSRPVAPGVLTPTQAFSFGPFLEALSRFDVTWRASSLNDPR